MSLITHTPTPATQLINVPDGSFMFDGYLWSVDDVSVTTASIELTIEKWDYELTIHDGKTYAEHVAIATKYKASADIAYEPQTGDGRHEPIEEGYHYQDSKFTSANEVPAEVLDFINGLDYSDEINNLEVEGDY